MTDEMVRPAAEGAGGAGVKAALVAAVADVIRQRFLAQTEAARLCRTDQPTLSKVLRGRHDLVSLDKLVSWLAALGRGVEIRIGTPGGAPGVTVRRADASEASGEAEERLRLAQEAAGIGTWDWDLATGAIRWSAEMYRVLGLDPARDAADPYGAWLRVLHPDDRERAHAAAQEHRTRAGEPFATEFRVVRPDGEVRWIMVRGRALPGPDGRPARVVGVNIDITERRRAEAALRESEERFRLLAEAMPGLVFVADAAGRNVYTNRRFQQHTGLSADELSGDGWLRALHPDDRERAAAAWRAAVAAGTPYEAEYRFRGGDGGYRWFLDRGLPAPGPDGRCREWFGVAVDIDDRRAAEEALRRSEEQRRLALEAAGLGVLDAEVGQPITADRRFRELYGLGEGEEVAPEEVWARVHPDDLDRVRAALDRAREPGSGGAYEAEYRVRLPGGDERWHLAKGRFGFEGEGGAARPARFVGVVMDVTARKAAEAALRESEQRYRALTEMSPDAIYVHRDGIIILANARAADMLGAKGPEDLVGRPVFPLVDPASRALAQARTARLRAPGDSNEPVRLVMRRLDGGRVVVEASSAAVLLDGRPAVQAKLRDITPREAAEAALRRSEEQRRLALEAAGLGLWDVDYLTGAVSLDGRFRDLYGLGPEEEVGSGVLWRWVHPEDAPRVRAAVARAKDPASGGVYEVEYRVVLRDGSERWHLAKAQVHFEGEGDARRAARFVGVVMDVTERRRAEAALRESEARLWAVVESLPFDLWVCDRDGRYLLQNSASRRNWGDRVDLRPEDADSPPDLPGRWLADNGRALAGETVRGEEDLDLHGETRHVEKVLAPIEVDGRVVGYVGVNVDVTERKRAEHRLAESEARYRTVFEQAAVGIKQIALADGRILAVNGALCRMLGYTADELLGLKVADIIHPDDLAVEQALLARLLAGEVPSYAIEKRYLRKGGEPVWVRATTSIPRNAGVRERYRISIVEDITARKAAEEHQRLLLGELSHRVKNMLAVVRGIALHSLDRGRTLEEAREVLEQRLASLATAHGLLTASDWRGVGLRELAAAELAPYEGRIAVGGPDVTLPPNVALSLALVLHELATNALKHGALSAPEGRVEVRWSLEGGRTLRLAWREEGGPEVAPPARRGFGSLLIERSVAHNLGGTARLEFRREGLAYGVELPLERA